VRADSALGAPDLTERGTEQGPTRFGTDRPGVNVVVHLLMQDGV
jgi:hypothetical protein